MFNNHTIFAVTDLNMIGQRIYDSNLQIVAVTDDTNYPNMANIYNAGILCPPISILEGWADGYAGVLENEYPRYLLSKEPDDMIIAILVALTQKDIVLYIPKDAYAIFGNLLLSHFNIVYGITVGNMMYGIPFNFNAMFIPLLLAKFYNIGCMAPEDFINAYPASQPLPPFVIDRLTNDMHPFNGPTTFEQRAEYFNNMVSAKNQIQMCKSIGGET